jgi:hypothetical protein
MLHAFELIATLCAALFAGAALYINVAEHPARMSLETRIAVLQWAPSYKRATWLQAPLALVSFLSGVVDSKETRILLERWARLHAVRTVLSTICPNRVFRAPHCVLIVPRSRKQEAEGKRAQAHPRHTLVRACLRAFACTR